MRKRKHTLIKIIAAVTSGIILTASIPASAAWAESNNIITNSTFDYNTTGWGTYKESGGNASLSVDSGRLALNITSLGTLNYSVQVYYDIVPLYQNGVYRLKFDISSTVDRYVEEMIQQNGGTYKAYTWKGINITSEPQTIDYTFTMNSETDIMSKLVFNCGNQGNELPEHTIYLDNVSLELIDDSEVDYTEFKAYEPPIVINQVGYKPDSKKTAVFREVTDETEFSVIDSVTGKTVYTGELYGKTVNSSADETDYFGDFTSVTEPGSYYISCGNLDDSYTFEISEAVYDNLLDDTVRMLYLQRCGAEVEEGVFSHPACHNTEAVIYGTSEKIDVTGGWHDAGDYGRYVVPGAKAVADLLFAYEAAPELYSDDIGIPESGNGIPDILDEVRYELEWMLKMQSESGGVYHKVTCQNFPGYIMPQFETNQLIVTPISTTATADFCASMAMAYEFYYDIDRAFAETCINAAEKAWGYLNENPNLIFEDPSDITTGDYGDSSDKDERYWAAAQLYRATGNDVYLEYIMQNGVKTGQDWTTVGNYGSFAILTMKDIDKNSEIYTRVKNYVISQADLFLKTTTSTQYGVAITKFNWGSNMTVANAGVLLGVAYDLTNDSKYLDAAESNLNYLLGKNPNGVCFVTGYGTVSPQNPHHRPSMVAGQAMKGMLVGGVNSAKEDSAAKAYLSNSPAAKCYIDHSESYSTNEITIYWNSPLTYLLSLTETEKTEIKGDINSDGERNTADLVLLQNYILGKSDLTKKQTEIADINKDGFINCFDIIILKRMLLNQ